MLRNSEPPRGRDFPTAPVRSGVAVRDAVFAFLQPLAPAMFKTSRKVGLPPLQDGQLPAISVYILGEDAGAIGLPNMGPLAYRNDTTLGISVARGFADPILLQGGLEQDVAFIKNLLMTNGAFTRRWYGALFESIPSYRTRWLYPNEGEAYYGELRLEMTFRFPESFVPTITDTLDEIDVTVQFGNKTGIDLEAKYYLWQQKQGYGNGSSNSSG